MIMSMTGYGRAVRTVSDREISVELRSVNNRYLDCTVKMPRLYLFAEDAVKKTVREHISRGKVDVFITVGARQNENIHISLNRPVLESYLDALHTMAGDYGVQDDLSVSVLARLPDVLAVEKDQEDEAAVQADILSVLAEAMENYNAMRRNEGAAMEADISARAATISDILGRVEARSPVTLAEYRTRLTAKMQEVLESTAVDESRILAEAAVYADRIAVDEETVRLRSHLEQLAGMLKAGGPVGRKLDFLMQEMNRETNTIGSKGNDLEQARNVVEIKAELEKIREQIQNIE